MDKIVFIIENHGDPSVGIASFTARVTLDDPIGYDDEDIQQLRKMFADHYDTPVTNVYTENEWNAFLKAEYEMHKHMHEGGFSNRICTDCGVTFFEVAVVDRKKCENCLHPIN